MRSLKWKYSLKTVSPPGPGGECGCLSKPKILSISGNLSLPSNKDAETLSRRPGRRRQLLPCVGSPVLTCIRGLLMTEDGPIGSFYHHVTFGSPQAPATSRMPVRKPSNHVCQFAACRLRALRSPSTGELSVSTAICSDRKDTTSRVSSQLSFCLNRSTGRSKVTAGRFITRTLKCFYFSKVFLCEVTLVDILQRCKTLMQPVLQRLSLSLSRPFQLAAPHSPPPPVAPPPPRGCLALSDSNSVGDPVYNHIHGDVLPCPETLSRTSPSN